MSELPPGSDQTDEVDDLYRRASALDPGRPSESVRRAVLEHAAKLAKERSGEAAVSVEGWQGAATPGRAESPAEDVPGKLGAARPAANQNWRRPAIFGTLAAACLAGLLIAPQFLPPRTPSAPGAPSTAALSKTEAARSRADAAAPRAESSAAESSPAESSPALDASVPAAPVPDASRPVASVPEAPLMAQRQSAEKARTTAGNIAPVSPFPQESARESAQDRKSHDAAPKPESLADARGEARAYGGAAAAGAPAEAQVTAQLQAQPPAAAGRLAGHTADPAAELRRAAEVGDVAGVRAQLDKQADVDARDAGGRTALMLATLHGQVRAVEALLSAGADPNAADAGGVTPLQAAVNGKQAAIAEALRRAGAR